MKNILILLAFFITGDCIEMTKGVFKGQYWTVIDVEDAYHFTLRQSNHTLKHVRTSYIKLVDEGKCK